MGIGEDTAARWREAQARQAEALAREVAPPPLAPLPVVEEEEETSALRDAMPTIVFAIVVGVIVAGIAAALEADALDARSVLNVVSVASGPLALVGIIYMLLLRTSRREAQRFGQTASAMRAQSASLEQLLASLSTNIDENRRALADHAQHLLLVGEDAASRLADIGMTMRAEAAALSRQSDKLDAAASTARADLGVLLTDLPRAEAQTQALAATLRDAGLGANQHAAGLEAQLTAIATRSREADEAAGGAAERLAAHLTRIENASDVASAHIDEAAARMSGTIEATLADATHAVDEVRKGIDSQQGAVRALVEQSSAAFERTGADVAELLDTRFTAIGGQVDALATRLAAQDAAMRLLLGSLTATLEDVEARFASLDQSGTARTSELAGALGSLREQATRMGEALSGGSDSADALIARTETLRTALAAAGQELGVGIPAALTRVTEQAGETQSALAALAPEAARVEASAAATADRLGEAGAAMERQQAALDALARSAEDRIAAITARGTELEALIDATTKGVDALSEGAAPRLVDALLRVHETAQASSERAREALAAVIPEAARALGAATGTAMETAMRDKVEAQIAAIAAAAERGVQSAEAATERLMQQMLTIGDASDTLEARVTAARDEREAHDEATFSRRVALLIESLNSTAIDVTKLLSNDVTDTAWAAYLKGDRGIFTRRAVRLLDNTEVREIARHHEENADFRDQVNRYIHDFEAMLRRVLATREGNTLGVTLLSSDMGKLYVALAQAIERLR